VWSNATQDAETNKKQNDMHLDALDRFIAYLLSSWDKVGLGPYFSFRLTVTRPEEKSVKEFWDMDENRRYPIFAETLEEVRQRRKYVLYKDETIESISKVYRDTFKNIMKVGMHLF